MRTVSHAARTSGVRSRSVSRRAGRRSRASAARSSGGCGPRPARRPAAAPAAACGAGASAVGGTPGARRGRRCRGRRRRHAGHPGPSAGRPGSAAAATRRAGGGEDCGASGSPCGGAADAGGSCAIGRPCWSYSTAGAGRLPLLLAGVELLLRLVELGLRLLGHLLGLVQETHGDSQPRFKASVKRRGTAGSSPSSHSVTTTQLAARLVLQADEHDVAVAHVGAAALRRGARRRLARDAARRPRLADARDDLGARVERPAHALAVALGGVVGDGDQHASVVLASRP